MSYVSPSEGINATKGIGEVFSYLNNVTDYWFGNLTIIAIWIIVLIGFYKVKDDFFGALAVASFSAFAIGLLLWLANIINNFMFTILVGVTVVSIIPLLMDR